jgi:hypothetical protein
MSRVELAMALGWLLIVGLGSAVYLSESPAAPAEVNDFRAEQQGVRGAAAASSSGSAGLAGDAQGIYARGTKTGGAGAMGTAAKPGASGSKGTRDSTAALGDFRYREDPRSDRSRRFAQVGNFGSPSGPSYDGSGASSSAAFAKADRSSSRLALPGSKSPASPVAYSAESSNPFGAAPSGGGGFGRGSSSWNGASDQSHRPEPPTAYAYHDEEYYCRTAREIREACENGGREPERYDFCLSFGGYYGNSRFCGYHP